MPDLPTHKRRTGYRAALIVAAAALVAFIATCTDLGGDTSSVQQAINSPGPDVMANANTAVKYATACGLGATPDLSLPDLGTAAAPIRGTDDATKVGTLASNGWTLVQHFAAAATDLAVSADKKGNLWHKSAGGREWYYLYRYTNAAPVAQATLNGTLGFDATSICALDIADAATPPADMSTMYFAGQFDNNRAKMDDCSDCHVEGYIAPRKKTLSVAKGNNNANDFPWLTVKWLGKWKTFAAAYGPVWKLGQATVTDKWTSGTGNALVTPPNECSGCHGNNWIPPRNNTNGFYCDAVFGSAFDANGSMQLIGEVFADNATCVAFINAIGCGAGRPMPAPPAMVANYTSLCPLPVAPPPRPVVNDNRMIIQSVQVVSSTSVNIIPAHNTSIAWDFGPSTGSGNPWVETLQVWGSLSTASTTSAMSSVFSVPAPSALPGSIPVTGLSPCTTYQFQLMMSDSDTSFSFEPLVTATTLGCGSGSDAGVGSGSGFPDAGAGSGSGSGSGFPDAGAGSGSGSGFPDAGAGFPDAGAGSGSGAVDAGACFDGGICPDAAIDAGLASDAPIATDAHAALDAGAGSGSGSSAPVDGGFTTGSGGCTANGKASPSAVRPAPPC